MGRRGRPRSGDGSRPPALEARPSRHRVADARRPPHAEVLTTPEPRGCGCPPTAPAIPTTNGVHHVIVTVNDLARSRPFYAALMPRLGYATPWDYGGGLGFLGPGGSFWIREAAPEHRGATFSKDRVGLCEVAFRADDRAHVDAIAREVPGLGGTILDPPREYPEYVPGYYAVFFADPDGIKLEAVHVPG